MTKTTSIWWKHIANHKNEPAQLLKLPGAIPLTSTACEISWGCNCCDAAVSIQWPLPKTSKVLQIATPSDQHHSLAKLTTWATASERLQLVAKNNLNYIVDTATGVSPSLLQVACEECGTQYLLSCALGIGQSSEPDTFGIRGIYPLAR